MTAILATSQPNSVPRFLRAARALVPIAAAALVIPLSSTLRAASVPAAPKVTVAPVEERILAEYEELTGRVDAVETVELRARVSGHLDAIHFQSGQTVAKGDLLFTIDPRWYRA